MVALQCHLSTVQLLGCIAAIVIHTPPLFWTFSHYGHHRALSRVPCVLQWVLISSLFYVNLSLPVHHSPSLLLGIHMSVHYVLLYNKIIHTIFLGHEFE